VRVIPGDRRCGLSGFGGSYLSLHDGEGISCGLGLNLVQVVLRFCRVVFRPCEALSVEQIPGALEIEPRFLRAYFRFLRLPGGGHEVCPCLRELTVRLVDLDGIVLRSNACARQPARDQVTLLHVAQAPVGTFNLG
jgi:hypothetical protein